MFSFFCKSVYFVLSLIVIFVGYIRQLRFFCSACTMCQLRLTNYDPRLVHAHIGAVNLFRLRRISVGVIVLVAKRIGLLLLIKQYYLLLYLVELLSEIV